MNITSFNITDVGYHYIGLRVLAAMPNADREEQSRAISRNVLKYARDKALRLMLPEPKGSYEAVGEKVCQELAHFLFAMSVKGKGYELTEPGKLVLAMLNGKHLRELRRTMALVHLRTYTNLRLVVHSHIAHGPVYQPSLETAKASDVEYISRLLRPTFGDSAVTEAAEILEKNHGKSAKTIENALRESVLAEAIQGVSMGLPLFRSMCDRLISLRLLNLMKVSNENGEFNKSYSPCSENGPQHKWHKLLEVSLSPSDNYRLYLSEPDMNDVDTENAIMDALDTSFNELPEKAGYFSLPDVRDFVCQHLMIPESAFDEGINILLDRRPAPITVGLTYEGISGKRKPLMRSRETTQIFNLIRRT